MPGNHDVDRKAPVKPRLWAADREELDRFQQVGSDGAQMRVAALLPRFAAYRDFEQDAASWDEDWLASDSGSICRALELGGAKLAVVGINTAWSCQDDDDWVKLTAGRTMVDAALKEAGKAQPELTIVLGHHPLDAMTGEQLWSDGRRIRDRLQQANAIYLHGHLHAAGNQRTGDSLQSVLAIQAPSAFQAGDKAIWRNGVMWGEVDLETGWVIVEPLKWNDDDYEYKFDIEAGLNRDRVPGRDASQFALPGHRPGEERSQGANEDRQQGVPPEPPSILPQGWRLHDRETLAPIVAERPDPATMADYFDGSLPSWATALADGLRPRQVVETTIRRLKERHQVSPRPLAVLLTGAGGEGKSTALLQVAAALARETTQSWSLVHREASAADVPEDLFTKLEHRDDHAWIVVLDDAENAAAAVATALRRIAPRTDIHVLMAAREADWIIRGVARDIWQGVADFRQEAMPGLDEVDARRIVEGWHAFGDTAMGRLRGTSVDVAAKALYGHANEHVARPGEGALLGALLFTRQGEELKDRVRAFVAPLKGKGRTKAHDLRDIYAMIAAMHDQNQLFLSRPVLLGALGCSDAELDRVLHVLRREAMLDSGETFVLTRHRRIAETACDALREDGYDVKQWFAFLARSAEVEGGRKGVHIPGFESWRFGLAEHFIGKGEHTWPLARQIAKAVHDANPQDPKRLVSYVNVLREAGAPGEAMAVLKEKARPFRTRRDVLFEWSVVAGSIGDYGLAVWLASRSLADGGAPPSVKDCKVALAGLGRVFELLLNMDRNPTFASGRAACGRLGLRLPDLDATARGYFESHSNTGSADPHGQRTVEADIEILRQAVIEAADETEPSSDPAFFEELLGEPEAYRYAELLRVIAGETSARRQNR